MIKECLEIGEREGLKNVVRNYKSVYNMCMLEHLIEDGETLDENDEFCDNKCGALYICHLAWYACLLEGEKYGHGRIKR